MKTYSKEAEKKSKLKIVAPRWCEWLWKKPQRQLCPTAVVVVLIFGPYPRVTSAKRVWTATTKAATVPQSPTTPKVELVAKAGVAAERIVHLLEAVALKIQQALVAVVLVNSSPTMNSKTL